MPSFQPVAAIIALVLAGAMGCSTDSDRNQDSRRRFMCDNGQALDVVRSKDLMIVRIGERIFNNLRAKPSQLGERFTDGEATLIIDGAKAVFVSAEGDDLRNCELNART